MFENEKRQPAPFPTSTGEHTNPPRNQPTPVPSPPPLYVPHVATACSGARSVGRTIIVHLTCVQKQCFVVLSSPKRPPGNLPSSRPPSRRPFAMISLTNATELDEISCPLNHLDAD